MVELFGPGPGEGPARRYGPVRLVAVLSDVHANTPALEAVLVEAEALEPDLVVFCGDLTWGPEPARTVELVRSLGERAVLLRGNAERAVLQMAAGQRAPETARDHWMLAQHQGELAAFLATFAFSAIVDIDGLGVAWFCHGSPRSDHEVVTPATAEDRFSELMSGVDEHILVTGHTHIQFDRRVAGWRSINPGSVGLPFHTGVPGTAYWATLGPDVTLRRTMYPVADSLARGKAAGDPSAETIARMLTHPYSPDEITAEVEQLVFSD
jgi:predicted phosphodiesterase